jgi:hypothetical protein
MSRTALLIATTLAVVSQVKVCRADDDPIMVALAKAKAARADTVSKAKAALLLAMDAAIKDVAGAADLDGAKALRAERKAFDEGAWSRVKPSAGSPRGIPGRREEVGGRVGEGV